MANELVRSNTTGATYALIRRQSDGYVWNGSAFEAFLDANITNYDVPLASEGGDMYAADFPADIGTGFYLIQYYLQAGASPSTGDLPNGTAEKGYWNGTTFATFSAAPTTAEIVAALAGSTINARTFVQREHVEVYRGDSYQSSEGTGRRIPFTKASSETHWPDTLDTVHLYVVPSAEAIANARATALERLDDIAGTVTTATGSGQAFYFELTAAQTDDLSDDAEPHDYEFQVVANKADHPATLREGTFSARQTLRTLS